MWKGPEVDGITQSLIGKFVQCPYRFYLYAILGLKDSGPLHPNLIWGDVYHKGLEWYIRTKDLNLSILKMVEYLTTKYPEAPSTYETSTKLLLRKFSLENYQGDWETELEFSIPITTPTGRKVIIRGKKDGLTKVHPEYGSVLGEHKCKGFVDGPKTRKELITDRQVNIYCYLHKIQWINYDLVLIPEAQKYCPARSYNESPTDWMNRLFTGPCGNYNIYPINANVRSWIHHLTPYYLSRSSQEKYWQTTVYPDIERMCQFWDYVNTPGFDHTNPDCFNHLFYKVPVRQFEGSLTEKFECEYYKYLIGEEELSDLVPVESLYAELEEK